jgi:hypothetical protein
VVAVRLAQAKPGADDYVTQLYAGVFVEVEGAALSRDVDLEIVPGYAPTTGWSRIRNGPVSIR